MLAPKEKIIKKAGKIIATIIILLLVVVGVGGYLFCKYYKDADNRIAELENKISKFEEKELQIYCDFSNYRLRYM